MNLTKRQILYAVCGGIAAICIVVNTVRDCTPRDMAILSGVFFAIALIAAILNAILFFKLWGACDNIKRIADKYAPEKDDKPRHSRTPETKEDVERWLNEDK